MPSPPCDRSSERVDLREHVEDVGQLVGGDADAVVPHRHHDVAALTLGGQGDLAAAVRVLGGVVQQVRRTPGPAGSGRRPRRSAGSGTSTVSSCPSASMSGRLVSTAASITAASSTRSLRSSSLPRVIAAETSSRSSTSRDHVRDLPLHQRRASAVALRVIARQLQDWRALRIGGQRVAELVGQRRQELVLAAVLPPAVGRLSRSRSCSARLRLGDVA